MDEQRFDSLARLLGQAANRREGVRAALGGLLGLGAGAAALDAAAKGKGNGKDRDARAEDDGDDDVDADKHKQCSKKKPCAAGYTCVKGGKKTKHGHKRRKQRTCVCTTGILCGVACCASGQTCQNGACVDSPEPVTCIAKGEACKDVGRPCCDGLSCASGQGGETDIACYVPKAGPCAVTADCVYNAICTDGVCVLVPSPEPLAPAATGAPCMAGQRCIDGLATCRAYQTGSGGNSGTYCLLADKANPSSETPSGCTDNAQCSSNRCAVLTTGGTATYCAPITCKVYLPVTTNATGTWNNIQAASNGLKTTPGTETMKDIGVYGGTYTGDIVFADDSWNVFSCGGTPILTTSGEDSVLITLDVNENVQKFVKIKGVTLAGAPANSFVVYGANPHYMNLTLENVTSTFTSKATLDQNDTVKVTVVDSTLLNMPIDSHPGTASGNSATKINYITLENTTHSRDSSGGADPGIKLREGKTVVELKGSTTVSGWATSTEGAGILFVSDTASGNYPSTLKLSGTAKITTNTAGSTPFNGSGIKFAQTNIVVSLPDSPAAGIYAYSTANPADATDSEASNCYGTAAACVNTPAGFTSV